MPVNSGFFEAAQPLTLVATTGASGYTLVNGTGNVFTWTAPNDGQVHRVMLLGELNVTTTEVGGSIHLTYTTPSGVSASITPWAAAESVGIQAPSAIPMAMVQAGTTVTLLQFSALTSGAAVLFAELWAA